ncbi:unnamed protein product [Phytophthora fragariaefolia]|uniref:Unnamed protein product n=1 Tax=Phytophthora fragariaefolia TaxID=1490495 RepID=A0A9W6WWL5_9STRA|nr:unnamed protein product [Phytophthora fragariaefolia]
MERCLASLLYKNLLVWIDDLLLYAKTVDEYLDKLEELFRRMNEFGFKLSATKSSVLKKQVKWCGKQIDGRIWNYQYLVKWRGYPDSDNSWEPGRRFEEDSADLVAAFEQAHEAGRR